MAVREAGGITGRQPRLLPGALLAVVGVLTAWAALFSWSGFVARPEDFLGPLLAVGLGGAATGVLLRRLRVPGLLVVAVQAVVMGLLLSWTTAGVAVPVGPGWAELVQAFTLATDSAQAYAAPVPASAPSLAPLLVAGGALAMLAVDALCCTARRAPLAGLPLLTVYSVPVSLLGHSIPVAVFVATALGYLTLLYLHESDELTRWGRPLAREDTGTAGATGAATTGFGVRTGAARAKAGTIGGVATALAVVVPVFVPTLDLGLLSLGQGDGEGDEVTIENPTADLLRDLIRGEDIDLISVRTDDPDPRYLRVTVLKRFSGSEWSPGNRDIPPENRPDGPMPPLEGVAPSVPRTEYRYDVEIGESFSSAWLPTQAPISAIRAEGDWRFDEATTDFFHWDEDLDAQGADYSMTAVDLDITARGLDDASPTTAEVSEEFLDLPDELSEVVSDLAFEVTSEATTRYEKAVALQTWFRRNFEYDLREGPEGSSEEALERFLTPGEGGRVGYCEQFAAAMATMARTLGIPARVSVGFLVPERTGQDTYVYSAHDLHAWPELYFDGFGWVAFEPTPGVRVPAVPRYARGLAETPEDPADPVPPTQEPQPDPGQPSAAPRPDVPTPETVTAGEDDEDAGLPWLRLLGGATGLALLGVALALPSWRRRRLRAQRLDGSPEAVWVELRATAADLGLSWPAGRSPRETRDQLVTWFGLPGDDLLADRPAHGASINPDAVVALDRIVADLERTRYARPGTGGQAAERHLRAEGTTCVEALEAGVPPRTRRRARLWPASVLPGARGRLVREDEAALGAATERPAWSAGLVEHLR